MTNHAAVSCPGHRLSPLAILALCILSTAALADDAVLAAGTSGPLCPVGILQCTGTTPAWSLCKRNDMLDF